MAAAVDSETWTSVALLEAAEVADVTEATGLRLSRALVASEGEETGVMAESDMAFLSWIHLGFRSDFGTPT